MACSFGNEASLVGKKNDRNNNNEHDNKEKKKTRKSEKRHEYNVLINDAKKYEEHGRANNDAEKLLNALVTFRRAHDIFVDIRGKCNNKLEQRIESLEILCGIKCWR